MIPALWLKAILVALALAALFAVKHFYDEHQRGIGRDEVQQRWDKKEKEQAEADVADAERKAREGLRRIEAQQTNQETQNHELKQARDDAARAATTAARMQRESDNAAKQWEARLADSPTAADVAAAGAAIGVCTDLLGRVRERARVVSAYADSARASGLKCERDYDALTPR